MKWNQPTLTLLTSSNWRSIYMGLSPPFPSNELVSPDPYVWRDSSLLLLREWSVDPLCVRFFFFFTSTSTSKIFFFSVLPNLGLFFSFQSFPFPYLSLRQWRGESSNNTTAGLAHLAKKNICACVAGVGQQKPTLQHKVICFRSICVWVISCFSYFWCATFGFAPSPHKLNTHLQHPVFVFLRRDRYIQSQSIGVSLEWRGDSLPTHVFFFCIIRTRVCWIQKFIVFADTRADKSGVKWRGVRWREGGVPFPPPPRTHMPELRGGALNQQDKEKRKRVDAK